MDDNGDQVELADVMDLSVIELYILNYLIRIAGSVVRFSVFNEINDQLDRDKLSRSSFYHSLTRLQEKGFVKIDSQGKGKTSSVRALPKAKMAIDQVNIFNIWGSVNPDLKFKELIQTRSDLFSTGSGKTQLFVSFQYPVNHEIVDLLQQSFDHTEILGDVNSVGPLAEEYQLVHLDNEGYIAKRDQSYDQIVVYRYAYNQLRLAMDFEDLIAELFRVAKPGGSIIFLALDDVQSTSNLVLESGIGTVLKETLATQSPSTIKELVADHIGPDQLAEENYQGLSLLVISL